MQTDYLENTLAQRLALHRAHPDARKFPHAYGFNRTFQDRGIVRDSDGTFHTSNAGALSLRFVGAANTLLPRTVNHDGWFTERFQDSTTAGVVYRLPGGRGFLAGYSDPWNSAKDHSGPCNLLPRAFDTPETAARVADRLAERYAEFCRKDDLEQAALAEKEEADARAAEIREEVRELIRGIRESRLAPVVCDTLRRQIRALRREARDVRARAAKILANPYLLAE